MLGFLIVGGLLVAELYDVDKSLTKDDTTYIDLYLKGIPKQQAQSLSYAEQVVLIEKAQHALMQRTKIGLGIPNGLPREPKDLYLRGMGLCYSRSRVLEKIYMSLGFETRHIAAYAAVPGANMVQVMTRRQTPSHATLEVKTKEGWLIVDSNNPWIGVDKQNQPYSLEKVQERLKSGQKMDWVQPPFEGYDMFYSEPCYFVYGLYSRHGQFYPPFTSGIPDYNLRELIYNL